MNALLLILLQTRVLTLEDGVKTATAKQPQVRQARAGTEAARARADEARSGLLPQLSGSATYQRTTSNFAPSPGLTTHMNIGSATFDTFNFWNFSLNATQ